MELGDLSRGDEMWQKFSRRHPGARMLDEIRADILALEQETEGLLGEIIGEIAK